MKWLKRIGIGLLSLILLLLIIAWFLPREMNVKVSSEMDAPSQYVYNIVNDYKNVPKWDPWSAQDETMKFTYGENTSGKDAWYSWDSEKMSTGKVTTKSSTPEKIEASIESPVMGICDVIYSFANRKEDKSTMTWEFTSTSRFPMNIMNFIMKSGVKKEFKKGLSNINELVKSRFGNATYDGFEIKEVVMEDKNYVIRRAEVPMSNFMQFYGKNQGAIFQSIQKAGVEMSGNPSLLVYAHNESSGVLDAAVAIPIKENIALSDASTAMLESGKALVVDYYGDSEKSEVAHLALDAFMRDRSIFPKYPVVEEYVTDASTEKDPSKWLTRIIYYIAE